MYEAIFNSNSLWWEPEWKLRHAIFWLICMERRLNSLLYRTRTMTLNDVCGYLGLPQSVEGENLGWEADPRSERSKIRFDLDPFDDKQIGIRITPEKVLGK